MSTTTRWVMTPLQFWVLLLTIGRDVMPTPLRYQPRFETADDFHAAFSAEVNATAPQVAGPLGLAMQVMQMSEARIELSGFLGADHSCTLRTHAVVRHDLGVVIDQEDAPDGGNIHMWLTPASEVGTALAKTLPAMPSGRTPSFEVTTKPDAPAEDDDWLPQSFLQPLHQPKTTALNPKTAWDRFVNATYAARGRFLLFPGPSYDNRPIAYGRTFGFAVAKGDGAYLVRKDHEGTLVDPVNNDGLAHYIQLQLDSLVAAYRADTAPRQGEW